MIGQTTSPFTQQSGWNQLGAGQAGGMGQFGQLGGVPSMYGQGQFGQGGPHADVGAVAGAVVASVLPHILGAQRGQQAGGYGQFGGGIPGLQQQGQLGQGQQGQQLDLGSILGPVVASVLGTLHGQSPQHGGLWGRA